jgi:hypothetical protein
MIKHETGNLCFCMHIRVVVAKQIGIEWRRAHVEGDGNVMSEE